MNARRLLALAIAAPLTIPATFIALSLLGELFGAPWYDRRALVFELALASAPYCLAASAAMAAPVASIAWWRAWRARRPERRWTPRVRPGAALVVTLLLAIGALWVVCVFKPVLETKYRAAKQEVHSCQMHLR